MTNFEPKPSNYFFNTLKDSGSIIMATNLRILNGVAHGVFRAAKKMDAVFLVELAKSECDLTGGYTGLTPEKLSKMTRAIAEDVKFDMWGLHADHITLKKGNLEEIKEVQDLIDAQVKAGYTSFAIDASFLFNVNGKTTEECLAKNIEVTSRMVKYVKNKMNDKEFGLEVEVGEIGYHDGQGKVKTKPEEAVTFLQGLKEQDVFPNVLAIANGSAHGNNYDLQGNLMAQLSIDISQTQAVAKAIRTAGLDVRIAQHGITGTPRELIRTLFPHKDVLKGNVGTFWQNIVWDTLKVYEPDLHQRMCAWTMEKFKEDAVKKGLKTEPQILGLYGKNATKEFFDELYSLRESTVQALESVAYSEALLFFEAFQAQGSAEKVRRTMFK